MKNDFQKMDIKRNEKTQVWFLFVIHVRANNWTPRLLPHNRMALV